MTTEVTLSVEARSAEANALRDLLNSGSVKIYSGAVPASVTTALGAQVLQATCPLQVTSAPTTSTGELTFDITGVEDTSIDADGVSTFYRSCKSNGDAVTQGSVGVTGSGESMTMLDTTLVLGGTLTINSFKHTV